MRSVIGSLFGPRAIGDGYAVGMFTPPADHWINRILPRLLPGLLLIALLGVSGCLGYQIKKKPRPETVHLELRHEAHGTSHATFVDGDLWYVAQGNQLLVLDHDTGRKISELDLMPAGHSGPAVGMIVEPTVIYVVLRDSGVVSLDRTDARRPWIETTWDTESLGIEPRHLSPGSSGPIVSGIGGSIQIPSLHRLVDHDGEVTSVVELESGALYTTSRRAYRVSDDEYVGSASSLATFPKAAMSSTPTALGSVLPENTLLFIRNETSGGLGGFAVMENGLLREVDSHHSTEALPGGVNRIRVQGDQVLIAGPRSVHQYTIEASGALQENWSMNLMGIRDVDFMGEDRIVVVGEFGQACFRTDRQTDPQVFRRDAPGGLVQAISDGRTIMATGVDGTWEYRIGDAANLMSSRFSVYPPPARGVALLGWEIRISPDGNHAVVSNDFGEAIVPAPVGSHFTTDAAGDGSFWLGHQEGVMMLRPPANMPTVPMGWEEMTEEERVASGYSPLQGVQKLTLQIDGPVIFIEPLDLGGGIAYAAGNGGFGVVRESW